MSYSRWFVNPTNKLLKLALTSESVANLNEAIQVFCNNTVSMTSKSCSSENLLYYCNSKLSSNLVSLFSCEGYVSNDCATSDKSCQTAGLIDDAMLQCMEAAVQNYSSENNMQCRENGEPYYTWLIMSLVATLPMAVVLVFYLKKIYDQCQKKPVVETKPEEKEPIPLTNIVIN